MNKPLQINCLNTGTIIDVKGGETLLELSERISLPFRPICARVNNKTETLRYPVYSPKTVEFLPATSQSGQRTYARSLCMMLYKAVDACFPGHKLRIEHSISNGVYCRISDLEVTQQTVDTLSDYMRGLHNADLPFIPRESPSESLEAIYRSQGLDDKVTLMRTRHEPYTPFYTIDALADSYYGALAPSTGSIGVFALHCYKEGLLLMSFNPDFPEEPCRPVAQQKMYEAFTDYLAFNRIVGISEVGQLNEEIEKGNAQMLINVCEVLHDKRIGTIADRIAERFRQGGARVVMVAGPSSSGKTTFTKRLAIHLVTCLLKPRMISLDDYFVDREHTPRDASGDYDYESLYALDIPAFNRDLQQLLDGQEVELPYYNFATGQREYRGNRISLDDRSILLIEGIHGLNPELTPMIDDKMKYRIYVSALTTISIDDHNRIPTTDNRLLRRIVRDAKYRGTDALQTIRRWPSVRRGEERWIFPFQENADSMFNSSLLYEMSVLKPRGEELLRRMHHDIPEYAEASRLLTFLSHFDSISEEYIPSTSLLREFLGGSSFKY